MVPNYFEMLRAFAFENNREKQQAFVFENPVLLSKNVQNGLTKGVSESNPRERTRLSLALEVLVNLRKTLEQNVSKYPIGVGPIERLWKQLQKGEINAKYAEKLARQAEVTSLLSPIYIWCLSNFAFDQAHQDKWQDAMQLQRLIIAAVQALPPSDEAKNMQWKADFDWVEIATSYLAHRPDGRIYRSALEAGERAAEIVKKTGRNEMRGNIYHRLGTLHFDTYFYGRTAANLEQEWRVLQNNLIDVLRTQLQEGIPDVNELKMPEPEKAFEIAESYYRKAIALRTGRARGASQKALAHTLEYQNILFKKKINRREIVQLCRDALSVLDEKLDRDHVLDLLSRLRRFDQRVDLSEAEKALKIPPDELVQTLGPLRALTVIQQAAQILEKDSPLKSVEFLESAHHLFNKYGNENVLKTLWIKERKLIKKEVSSYIPSKRPKGGAREVHPNLVNRAQKEKWNNRKISSSLIALAENASHWDEEDYGLLLLDEAKRIDPIFVTNYENAIDYLRAKLYTDLAVNKVNIKDWAPAIKAYANALRIHLYLNLVTDSMDCLRRIDDLAEYESAGSAMEVLLRVGPLVPKLENEIGEVAILLLQSIFKKTIAAMSMQMINPELLFGLLQIAKGFRFGEALYSGSRYQWQEDGEGLMLLQQIREAKLALPPDSPVISPSNPDASLDENTLLTSYSLPGGAQAGDNAEERLINLQQKYDEHLNKLLLGKTPIEEFHLFSTTEVQAALDERTVLLYFYNGRTQDGRLCLYVLLLTRDDLKFSPIISNFPDIEVFLGDGDRRVKAHPSALVVAGVRNTIEADPAHSGQKFVSKEAGEGLKRDLRNHLGYLVEYLDELNRAGKDHLCIVPHGPQHYYPFHLLGEPGKPLADKWKITYLPNLQLFTSSIRAKTVHGRRNRLITAIGISFEKNNRYNLVEIPEAVTECEKIAEIFDDDPVTDEDATEERVLEALKNSRYVHLSTHGRHNVNAPAFHCLYVTPKDQSEGVIFAHELLSQDLRGLEVLTLGACETALGRFDLGDNLRGLPASFLLAGVSTIIGTLWPAETNASECFFKAFYSELNGGSTRLDAFATAQSKTREAYPEYRDWGPFYLIGDWT